MSASKDLLSHMKGLFMDQENGDFTLFCAGVPMKVHSFILATRSPFFEASLSTPMTEMDSRQMEIMNCSPHVLKQVLRFMYGVNFYQGFFDYANLLEIAERFLMEDLKAEASRLLASSLNHQNYVEMSQIADKFNAKVLADRCAQFILYKALDVNWEGILEMPTVSKSIMELSKQKLTYQIGSEDFNNDLVFSCISQFECNEEYDRGFGISKKQLFAQIKSKITKIGMKNSLNFLSEEGYIYSTSDEDHFKALDEESNLYYVMKKSENCQ